MGETLKKIRLIRKTSKTFLGISALLMLVSTVALYFYLRNLLQSEVEE
ncbi:MAG: two-component sensor histidine kinase, partial [Muricauda sp.]|nr:two-component sensor histidine kinase [Allomuricauda sp.]